jgi:hypothetical protein
LLLPVDVLATHRREKATNSEGMKGYLHVFRAGNQESQLEHRIPEYQVNYTAAGRTYTRLLDEPELLNFFREGVAMDSATLAQAVDELRASGQTTVGGLEISEGEAYALGLEQNPTEI